MPESNHETTTEPMIFLTDEFGKRYEVTEFMKVSIPSQMYYISTHEVGPLAFSYNRNYIPIMSQLVAMPKEIAAICCGLIASVKAYRDYLGQGKVFVAMTVSEKEAPPESETLVSVKMEYYCSNCETRIPNNLPFHQQMTLAKAEELIKQYPEDAVIRNGRSIRIIDTTSKHCRGSC